MFSRDYFLTFHWLTVLIFFNARKKLIPNNKAHCIETSEAEKKRSTTNEKSSWSNLIALVSSDSARRDVRVPCNPPGKSHHRAAAVDTTTPSGPRGKCKKASHEGWQMGRAIMSRAARTWGAMRISRVIHAAGPGAARPGRLGVTAVTTHRGVLDLAPAKVGRAGRLYTGLTDGRLVRARPETICGLRAVFILPRSCWPVCRDPGEWTAWNYLRGVDEIISERRSNRFLEDL